MALVRLPGVALRGTMGQARKEWEAASKSLLYRHRRTSSCRSRRHCFPDPLQRPQSKARLENPF
jgi:hypothetical protein